MSAIRPSSSALLLLGGVATLPGAATVRSRFPQRSPPSDSADAELGYMQQPLGPVSSSSTRTASPTAVAQKTAPRSSSATATAVQIVTMATVHTRPQAWDESDAGYRPKSAREMVVVILGRNRKYSSL
ncbi:uncharacterized protein GLRG_02151 [Colletotrichum graminicola M1.001]|uniref:Uncharacterized protein n=1 Tax=Colletotrichum graminicola (strain M1.001 / M2 / FGSC 10212) TaxID=645133 RepID=E3Q7W8_COLGM|nr:uncharacterized protein GLRG_02151 [Colletotrichum graminicola M1.001]EFQ26980.1 hypothetical protein GLRG_02151 [Colletotrichum graminicola M1.001]